MAPVTDHCVVVWCVFTAWLSAGDWGAAKVTAVSALLTLEYSSLYTRGATLLSRARGSCAVAAVGSCCCVTLPQVACLHLSARLCRFLKWRRHRMNSGWKSSLWLLIRHIWHTTHIPRSLNGPREFGDRMFYVFIQMVAPFCVQNPNSYDPWAHPSTKTHFNTFAVVFTAWCRALFWLT